MTQSEHGDGQRILAIAFSAVILLNFAMLLLDERLPIFPFVFGFDIRYLLSVGMLMICVGATLVVKGFRRLHK